MSYLFDADICVDLLRNKNPRLAEKVRDIPILEHLTSVVVEGELRVGAEKTRSPRASHRIVEEFLGRFTVLSVDRDVARKYAEIRAAQEKKGIRIGNNDLFMAATALVHDLTLVTRNVREYGRIEGLKLESFEGET